MADPLAIQRDTEAADIFAAARATKDAPSTPPEIDPDIREIFERARKDASENPPLKTTDLVNQVALEGDSMPKNQPDPQAVEVAVESAVRQDWPAPSNSPQLRRDFAKYNIHFDAADEPMLLDMRKVSTMLTLNTLAVLGLYDPKTRTNSAEATDELFKNLNNAYFAQLSALNRSLTDEERPRIQERMFRSTMNRVEQEGLRELTDLQAQGKAESPEALQLIQDIAIARDLGNRRVVDPEYLREFSNSVKRTHDSALKFDTNVGIHALGLGAERQQAARLWEVADAEKLPFAGFTFGELPPAGLDPSIRKKQNTIKRLLADLSNLQNPTVLSDFFVKTGQDAVTIERHALLGITPEMVQTAGAHDMLKATHSSIYTDLMDRSARAIARKTEGLTDVGADIRGVRDHKKRMERSLNAAVEVFTKAMPLASPARQAGAIRFDPSTDSLAEDFADVGSSTLAHIGVAIRAADEFFRRGMRGLSASQPGSLSAFQKTQRRNEIPIEQLSATTVIDIASGRVGEEGLRDLVQTPQVGAGLRENVQMNNLTYYEMNSITNEFDDPLTAAAILRVPALLDTATRIIVTDRQKGLTVEAIKADVRAGMAQVMQDMLSNPDTLGSKELSTIMATRARKNALKLNARLFGPGVKGGSVPVEAISYLVGLTGWATNVIIGETRRMAAQVLADPSALGSEVMIGLAFEPIAGPAVGAVLKPVRNLQARVRSVFVNQALKRDLTAGLTHSPNAVKAVQDGLKDLKLPDGTPLEIGDALLDRLDSLTDATAEITRLKNADTQRGFNGEVTDNVPQFTQAVNEFKKNLRGVDSGDIQRLLELGGASDAYIQNSFIQRNTSLLKEISGAVGRKMGMWGTKAPTWITDNTNRVFRAMTDALEKGTLESLNIDNVVGLLSHRAADKVGQGRAKVFLDRGRASLTRQGRIDARAQAATIGPLHDYGLIKEYFTNVKKHYMTFRDVAAGKRRAANSFMSYLSNGRRRRGLERAIYGADPAPDLEAARLADVALRQGQDIHVALSVRYDGHPVMEAVRIDDMVAWAGTQQDALGDFYSRMSRPNETRVSFSQRVDALSPEDLLKFKDKFAREYLNAPDINTTFGYDNIGGAPLGKADLDSLRGMRKAARDAWLTQRRAKTRLQRLDRDPNLDLRDKARRKKELETEAAEAGELVEKYQNVKGTEAYLELLEKKDKSAKAYGVTTSNISENWKTISKWADLEDTNELMGIVQRIGTERSGDFQLTIADMQGAFVTHKAQMAAMRGQVSKLTVSLNGQTPEFRDAFRKALRAQVEEGDYLTLQQLRDKAPDVFDSIPETYEKNIEYLLTKDKDLRRNFGMMLRDAGVIDENEFARFAAPYLPRRYEAYGNRYLVAKLQDDTGGAPGPIGLTADELEARREIGSKWRLIVRARNSAPTEMLFPTRAAAEKHIRKNFARDFKATGSGDFDGTTATGDRFQVLAPIGRKKADLFSVLADDAALLKSWWELSRTTSKARTAQLIDRPGIAYAPDEWEAFQKTDAGRAAIKDFYEVPTSREFGSLKGKRLHKNAWSMLREASEMVDDVHQMLRALEKAQDTQDGFLARTFNHGKTGLANISRLGKQFVSAQIFRNPGTHITNLLSDYIFYGRAATDSGWHFTAKAMSSSREAWDMMFPGGQFDTGVEKLLRGIPDSEHMLTVLRLDPDFEDMTRLGIFDDSMAGAMLHGQGALAMRELIYGKADPGTGVFAKLKRGQFFRQKIAGDLDAPATKALRKRTATIEASKGTPEWDALSAREQLALDNELVDKTAILQRTHRSIVGLGEIIDGLSWLSRAQTGRPSSPKGLGAFKDHSSLSAEIYQRWANYMRVRAYKYNRKTGLSPEESARKVNTFMQTYSGVPRALKDLSNSLWGSPVLSFPHEFIRTGYNTMVQRPGLFAGLWSAMPIMNIFSMGISGADPEKVFQELNSEAGGLPGYTLISSGLLIPDGGGHFKFVHVPWSDGLQLLRAAPGIVGNLLDNSLDPNSLAGAAVNAPINFANRVVANNPGINFGTAVATGRDPLSGRKYQSRTLGLLDTVKQIGKVAVPPLMPGILSEYSAGRVFGGAVKVAKDPGNKVAGRAQSVLDRTLSSILGIRLKGVWEKGHFEPLARTMLFLGGDPEWQTRELRGTGAFGDRDLKANLIFQSRRVDPNAPKMEFALDTLQRELEGAIQTHDVPRQKDIMQRMRDRRQFTMEIGTEKLLVKATDEEIRKKFDRAVDAQDIDKVVRSMSVHQKAWMLSTYAALADTPELVEELFVIMVTTPVGELISTNSPTQLERAITTGQTWLATAESTALEPERRSAVERFVGYLQHILPDAQMSWALEAAKTRATSEAHRMVFE